MAILQILKLLLLSLTEVGHMRPIFKNCDSQIDRVGKTLYQWKFSEVQQSLLFT